MLLKEPTPCELFAQRLQELRGADSEGEAPELRSVADQLRECLEGTARDMHEQRHCEDSARTCGGRADGRAGRGGGGRAGQAGGRSLASRWAGEQAGRPAGAVWRARRAGGELPAASARFAQEHQNCSRQGVAKQVGFVTCLRKLKLVAEGGR